MKTFYILLLLTVFLGCTSQPDNVSPTEQEKIIDVSKQLAPFGIKVATPLLSKDYDEISYIVRGESFIEAGSGRSFSLNHARVSVRNLHDYNPSLQFLNEDELVTYRLSLNLFRNELVFYRNKEKLVSSDNIQKVKPYLLQTVSYWHSY